MSSNSPEHFVFYRYTPTLAGAIILALAFALSTLIHGIQIVRMRGWYFLPLFIGALFEAGGYVFRGVSHFHKDSLDPFLGQTLLLLLAPALFAASIYIILGRIIILLKAQSQSPVRVEWLTKIFVLGDVLSFLMQGSGGGLMATARMASAGQKIVVLGLCVQIIWFGCFVLVAWKFHRSIRRYPTPEAKSLLTDHPGRWDWQHLLYALYVASVLILVRSVFRVVEFIQGNAGYLLSTEVWLYLFDGLLMLIVVSIFNVIHPVAVCGHKPLDVEMNSVGAMLTSGNMERS